MSTNIDPAPPTRTLVAYRWGDENKARPVNLPTHIRSVERSVKFITPDEYRRLCEALLKYQPFDEPAREAS